MTISDFTNFIKDISTACNRHSNVTDANVLHEIAVERDQSGNDSIELECACLWGIVHGARVFGFLYARGSEGSAVTRALAKYDLGCTWKKSPFEDNLLDVYVYARKSALGKKVASGLVSLKSNSEAQGTQLDTDLGTALGYPTPASGAVSEKRAGAMHWKHSDVAGGVLFFTSLNGPPESYSAAVVKCEKLWTQAMRKISPDITCYMVISETKTGGTTGGLGLFVLCANLIVITAASLLLRYS